jgi:hypothetical protein
MTGVIDALVQNGSRVISGGVQLPGETLLV